MFKPGRYLAALLGAALIAVLAGCTSNSNLKPSANCYPGAAQTTLNNVTPGKTVTVFNTGVDCQVDFTRDDRQITVGVISGTNHRTYAKTTITAGVDGQYRTKLQLPKNLPAGKAYIGVVKGITVHCDDNASCATTLRQVDVVTVNGFPQSSFSPPAKD